MKIRAIAEYNDEGAMLHLADFVGAFVRGETVDAAIKKIPAEVSQYQNWLTGDDARVECEISIVQTKLSGLRVSDADTDVVFTSELVPNMTPDEYQNLKDLALRSAKDFQTLYDSIPDKNSTSLKRRKTFYGEVPITANEMYVHTRDVNFYYFGEIGVFVSNKPDIIRSRQKGFAILERTDGFLKNEVFNGSFDEIWTLRKFFRRFLWHDRIHAKALYRMARSIYGDNVIANPFKFE